MKMYSKIYIIITSFLVSASLAFGEVKLEAQQKYSYCMSGMYIELDNACFDALLQERKGIIKFKERKHICDSLGVKVTSKQYEEVTDFLLTARYARSLKTCVK